MRIAMLLTVCAAVTGPLAASSITEDLSHWMLGINEPYIANGNRGEGGTGDYLHLPVGTSPFYYECMDEGEGSVVLWLLDPGNCLNNPNPGYPNGGPMWGLQTSEYAAVCVGIGRPSYAAGCQGYSPWSTVAPYSYLWFKDGVRASLDHSFTPGWYKWTLACKWDDISFTLHDVTYEIVDGAPHDDDTYGDCMQTYDGASFGGAWEAVFGDGFISLYLRGDGNGGVEAISAQVVDGTGVFEEIASGYGYVDPVDSNGTPVIVSPQAAVRLGNGDAVTWSCFTGAYTSPAFTVQVALNASFPAGTQACSGLTDSSVTLGTLAASVSFESGMIYYVRVRTEGTGGAVSSWSDPAVFIYDGGSVAGTRHTAGMGTGEFRPGRTDVFSISGQRRAAGTPGIYVIPESGNGLTKRFIKP